VKTRKYKVVLCGESPLLMHRDNIKGCEMVRSWIKNPANKKISVAGDDRSPAFTWVTYCYHDGKRLVIDADNLMTMLRDGGKKCPAPTGRGSLKSQTQSGITVNEIGWPLLVSGAEIPWAPIEALLEESDFEVHEQVAKNLGFELFAKRARIGTSKNVRVRPRFDEWSASGTITVFDEILKTDVLQNILTHAGFYCGLMDWRPGSPSAPGQYVRFSASLEELKG